jgi:GntR family phosphonate transport system transcriptional regulator
MQKAIVEPRYRRIAADLRQAVEEGIYRPGNRLPTEKELSEYYGVNRHTLRRALQILQKERILHSHQGRGIYVSQTPIRFELSWSASDPSLLEGRGPKIQVQTLETIHIKPSPELTAKLGVTTNTLLLNLKQLGYVDEAVICWLNRYFPIQPLTTADYQLDTVCQGTLQSSNNYLGYFNYEDAQSCRPKLIEIASQAANAQDARYLDIPSKTPVLVVQSVCLNPQNQIVEYGIQRFKGNQVEFMILSN